MSSHRAASRDAAVDRLLDAWDAAWSGREPGAFAPLCAPGFHYEDPLLSEPLDDPAELGRHASRMWGAFPDARMESTGSRLHDGEFVAAPVKVLGTHREALEGLPPSGRFIVAHCVFYCELRDERLFRVRAFYDVYGIAVQLGVLPQRGTLGERALLVLRGFGLRSKD